MEDKLVELRKETAEAIRQACAEMADAFGSDPLHGFALCTDDDVCTLYSAACTASWVKEQEADYEEIGSIYVEWSQPSGDAHFDSISEKLSAMASDEDTTFEQRFKALVLALQDCRDEGLFKPDVLLCCASTDPSEELVALTMQAVDRLNQKPVADLFAEHLGCEEFREGGE